MTRTLLALIVFLIASQLGVIGYLVYSNRTPDVKPVAQIAAVNTVLKRPGEELAATMQVYVNENPLVTALQLVDIDLTRNTRQVVWFYSDNAGLTRIYEDFERTKTGPSPWLIGGGIDVQRQLSIINGAYYCSDIAQTPLPKRMIGIEQYVKHICVVAVPPDYGKFSGYMSAWLTNEPTPDEIQKLIDRLRSFSSRIN